VGDRERVEEKRECYQERVNNKIEGKWEKE